MTSKTQQTISNTLVLFTENLLALAARLAMEGAISWSEAVNLRGYSARGRQNVNERGMTKP